MKTLKITTNSTILEGTSFNVFCKKEFLRQQSADYGWIHNDEYLIPYYIKRKYIFNSVVFTSDAISLKPANNKVKKQLFLDSIINELPELLKVDSISCSPSYVLFDQYPMKSNFCEFGSYRIDLSQSEEDLFQNLNPKNRSRIRKSKRDGVTVNFDRKQLKICFDIINSSLKSQGLYFMSFDELNSLQNSMDENFICSVSYKNNTPQSAALIFWNNLTGYYVYGGNTIGAYNGSMNILQWETILLMKSLNVKYYDFVGARLNVKKDSKLDKIQDFKRKFGSNLTKGYLWKHDFNYIKVNLYKILIFLKSRTFPKDIVDEEN